MRVRSEEGRGSGGGYHAAVRPALFLLLLVTLATGCGPPGPPKNLLVIVIDTLRSDALGIHGDIHGSSPNIDALAKESLVFDRAFAQGTYTPSSFMSYMTSTWVRRHGWDYHVAEYPPAGVCGWTDLETLAEVLRRNGFATTGLVANHRLHPKLGFARGFEFWNLQGVGVDMPDKEVLAARGYFFGDPVVVREAVRDIEEWEPDRRNFLYVHLMAPHLPLKPSPEGVKAVGLEPDWAPRGKVGVLQMRHIGDEPTPEQKKMALEGYRASVWDGDQEVGLVLEALEDAGHRDDTVVAFFADHGEGLWEHGEYGHSQGVWKSLAHVPLMLRAPGLAPARIDDRAVALIDVAPTLLSLLGVEDRPKSWQGRSLLEPPDGRPVFTERFGAVGVTTDGRYRIWGMPGTFEPGWHLVDLMNDPGETSAIDDPARKRALVRDWFVWQKNNPRIERDLDAEPTGLCREMTDEDRSDQEEALRALGYLQ
jgi:uncharacterized sulfatase